MSDQHSQRAASLEARLTDVKMEIDDDDEDVILVMVNLTNEAAIPMGGLDIKITTSDGQKVSPKEGITSLGPGVSRSFTFEFPLDNGQWSFKTSGDGKNISLGPYEADFTYHEQAGRKLNNAIGSNLFTGAFTEHLSDFGNTEEKEIIDSSSVVLTTYHGENAEGGATKINVGAADIESEEEDAPRTPPWQKSDTVEPVSDSLSTPLYQPANEVRTPSWENNEVTTTVADSAPVDLLSVAAATVTTEPEAEPSPVSSAPTGPPAVPSKPAPAHSSAPAPPSGPPAGPPSAPPSGPPSGPPAGPPSAPPSGPPAGPPSSPPSAPPSGPPAGPPSGPPSSPPSRPSDL